MALTANYIYDFALKLIKKNQSGSLTSLAFAKLFNDAQSSYFDDLVGRFQNRNDGKEGANTGLIENETIMQKLSPFITPATLTITAGLSNKPDDFIYRLAMRISGVDVFKINHNQIATVNASVIDPPNVIANKYYFIEYKGYYSFLPNTVTTASLDYIATPKLVVWGYTFDNLGRQVYNQGLSVNPQWDSHSCMEIVKRMLETIGVSLKDNDFANFGKSVIATGT